MYYLPAAGKPQVSIWGVLELPNEGASPVDKGT